MATNLQSRPLGGDPELFSPEEAQEYIGDMLAELQLISRVTDNIRLQYYLLQAREAALGVEAEVGR